MGAAPVALARVEVIDDFAVKETHRELLHPGCTQTVEATARSGRFRATAYLLAAAIRR
jgi:hypothetical protein